MLNVYFYNQPERVFFMWRVLKRVPLDFKWPQWIVWKWYVNPYSWIDCKYCNCVGYNQETMEIHNSWYESNREPEWEWVIKWVKRYNKIAWCNNLTQEDVQALLDADRLWDFTRVPLNEEQKKNCFPNWWTKEPNGYIPTADDVNKWNRERLWHDSINHHICVEAKAKRLWVFWYCECCEWTWKIFPSEEFYELSENWVRIDPPEWEGYQLWENTSEWSPDSPVFDTLEKLCEWCEENATTFAHNKTTKEQWMKMLDDWFVHHREGNIIAF